MRLPIVFPSFLHGKPRTTCLSVGTRHSVSAASRAELEEPSPLMWPNGTNYFSHSEPRSSPVQFTPLQALVKLLRFSLSPACSSVACLGRAMWRWRSPSRLSTFLPPHSGRPVRGRESGTGGRGRVGGDLRRLPPGGRVYWLELGVQDHHRGVAQVKKLIAAGRCLRRRDQ